MSKQTIINGVDTFSITKDDALKLELKINLLKNKDYWREIGDKLYDFHAKNINNDIDVTNEQNRIMLRILKN
jgi:hypothetical protein